jgi:2-methylaconitate cis-trans-isomerase PrpF
MSFAALETRVNASVMKVMANASATVDGVAGVAGIFKIEYVESNGGNGMSGLLPTFKTLSSNVPATPVGKSLVNAGLNYVIAEPKPDGTGLTLLILERVA